MKDRILTLLFRPFEKYSDFKALAIGLIAMLFTGIAAVFGKIHYDGIIDVHFGKEAPAIIFMVESFLDWIVFSIVLFFGGMIFSKSSVRLIDVLGTQALARWPMLIVALASFPLWKTLNNFDLFSPTSERDTVSILMIALPIILISIWVVVLMYRAYSLACNIKGNKAIISFIIGLLISEAAVKYLLFMINNHLK